MKLAQVGDDRLMEPAHAVVAAVGMEVGTKVGAHRQLQASGGLQRRPAKRAFGHDVHQVGPLLRPKIDQGAFGRQAHAQMRIARDRQAPKQHFVQARRLVATGIGTLARPDQTDVVIAPLQSLHHLRCGERHAIDFRRVGFGDDRNPQRASRGRQIIDLYRCSTFIGNHPVMIAVQQNNSMTF